MRSSTEKLLVLLLRVGGTVMLLAWPTIVLPTDWMAASHRWLGLGAFPDAPLTQYLTRSIAMLYAIHGGFLWVLSTDVRRFAPLILYLSSMNVVFGAIVLGVDVWAGMPWYWTVGEGPPVAGVGALQLFLLRRLQP